MGFMSTNKIVTIIYRFFPQYRYVFYNCLREELAKNNITLNLVYGKNPSVPRKDEVDIKWGTPVKNKIFKIFGQVFYWIPAPRKLLKKSDLIIIVQENKIISNYPILISSIFTKKKIAFWGHGVNFQSNRNFIGNKIKKIYSTKVCWWFAYTQSVANIIANMGFPKEHITIVENSIDTKSIIQESDKFDLGDANIIKIELGLKPGPIGIYCGAMYKEKRLNFLIEVCKKIRNTISNFQMLFLGAGQDAALVQDFCNKNAWAHYLGPKFENSRIPYFKISDVFLLPGAMGLAILDSFAFEVPIITSKYPYHGPEIDYLIPGYNGIITENTISNFSDQVISLLQKPDELMQLKKGCNESKTKYTNENMVNNFATGIIKALTV
jgi:glycosyltransferase involved in cell wall biosynthesis